MKRDMDLIKAILLESEKACRSGAYYQPEAYSFRDLQADEETLQEHCRLIAERGLANGTLTREGWRFSSLTWDGHDFLDNARNDSVWRAAKDAAGRFSFGVFTATLTEAAKAAALKALEKVF